MLSTSVARGTLSVAKSKAPGISSQCWIWLSRSFTSHCLTGTEISDWGEPLVAGCEMGKGNVAESPGTVGVSSPCLSSDPAFPFCSAPCCISRIAIESFSVKTLWLYAVYIGISLRFSKTTLQSESLLDIRYPIQFLPCEELHLNLFGRVIKRCEYLPNLLALTPHVSVCCCLAVYRFA